MLRVFIIRNTLFPGTSNTAAYLLGCSKYLSKLGSEVHVVVHRTMFQKLDEEYGGFFIHRVGNPVQTGYGLLGVQMRSYGLQISFMIDALHKIKSLVKGTRGNAVLHCLNPFSSVLPALCLSRFRPNNVKVIYDERSPWIEIALHNRYISRNSPILPLIYHLENFCLKKSDGIITITYALKEWITDENGVAPEKIAVIPSGVDVELFRPSVPSSEFLSKYDLSGFRVISHIGSTSDITYLINAFSLVSNEANDVKFLLVGGFKPEFNSAIKSLIARKKLHNRVILVGPVDHREVPLFINASDICLIYLPDHLVYRVSSPLKILEYMACGKPVVGNSMTATSSFIKDNYNGFLVKSRKIKAFADAILRLLNDRTLYNRLSSNARRTAEENSWSKRVEELQRIYEAVLSV